MTFTISMNQLANVGAPELVDAGNSAPTSDGDGRHRTTVADPCGTGSGIATAVAVAMLFAACAPGGDPNAWRAETGSDVYVASDVPDMYLAGIQDSVAWWDALVPGLVPRLVVADAPKCGTIWITVQSIPGDLGRADHAGCYVWVRLSPKLSSPADVAFVVSHETAHAWLGPDHRDGSNVLGLRVGVVPTLDDDQRDELMAMLEAKR